VLAAKPGQKLGMGYDPDFLVAERPLAMCVDADHRRNPHAEFVSELPRLAFRPPEGGVSVSKVFGLNQVHTVGSGDEVVEIGSARWLDVVHDDPTLVAQAIECLADVTLGDGAAQHPQMPVPIRSRDEEEGYRRNDNHRPQRMDQERQYPEHRSDPGRSPHTALAPKRSGHHPSRGLAVDVVSHGRLSAAGART
jgi:hypothetical protein